MCINIKILYSECGHEAEGTRPCQEDGSRCGNMVTSNLVTIYDFCQTCFMLPDPRVSRIPIAGLAQSLPELLVSDDLHQDVQATTQHLQSRLQSLLTYLTDNFDSEPEPNITVLDYIVDEVLSRDSLELLRRFVQRHLLPNFWIRIVRGENPPQSHRELILYLKKVLELNIALHDARTYMSDRQWCIAVGYPYTCFNIVELPLENNDPCGICYELLNRVDEQGVPVSTACDHMFHRGCLEEWADVSPNSNCPACRAPFRVQLPEGYDIQTHGPTPYWLTLIIAPAPPAMNNIPLIAEPDIVQLELDVQVAHLNLQTRGEEEATIRAARTDYQRTRDDARDTLLEVLRTVEELHNPDVELSEEENNAIEAAEQRYHLIVADLDRITQRLRIATHRATEEFDRALVRFRDVWTQYRRALNQEADNAED